MLIFVDQVTERLQYTLDFIFTRHGLDLDITNDVGVFLASSSERLVYSSFDIEDFPQIEPSVLLFDEEIRDKLKIDKVPWQGIELLTINGKSDPLAAIFFILSRYEEYVILRRDKHNRFEAKDSYQYKFGWLEMQIVEHWIEIFIQKYNPKQLPKLTEQRDVLVIPTFDIDNTYAFKWKEGVRGIGAIAKDVFRRNHQRLELRKAVHNGTTPDPYDTFETIRQVAKDFPSTRVFWLLGDYGEYDRNISWRDPRHQRLIRLLANELRVGIHPSYASNISDKRLSEEIHRLATIMETPVKESRQHFLKLSIPFTYRRLEQQGILHDFSMGYADQVGFRAGTAHPFFIFDLEKNLTTSIQTFPFVYMDGSFNDYLQISVDDSKLKVAKLYDEVKKYGGVFSFIWHNETIGSYERWKGWNELLYFTLNCCKNEE